MYQEIKQVTTKTTTTMKIWITVAESMGTDGVFSSEVYPSTSEQSAGETAVHLISDLAMSMGMDIDPYTNWELEGDGWFYRVRVEGHEI